MRPPFQFAFGGAMRTALARPAAWLLATLLLWPAMARGQEAPSGAVGRVEGRDISVEGGVGGAGRSTAAPSIYVSNGSVVTVHAGKARMALFAGGKITICGPAKFTVLLSGDAITLALNFGRMRVELPEKTSLRIFTPTIVGTPIDISGGARDVTVGLSLDDSLCVLATSGAIRLEHQFTGEKIIVPQAGEFFLNAGKLLPVAGTPGTCACLADEPNVTPSAPVTPEFATDAPAESQPGIEYSVLQRANRAHPVVASARSALVAPPAIGAEGAVLPALAFSAGAPLPPPGPSQDLILLIRDARVSPEWQFTGRVEPPAFAVAMQHALGEHAMNPAANRAAPAQPPAAGKKKKRGIWASLKRAFGGGAED